MPDASELPSRGCPKPCCKVKASDEDAAMDMFLESGLAVIAPEEVLPWVPFARRSATYPRVFAPSLPATRD